MHTQYNPGDIAPTFSNYAHGVETPEDARWLHISGQLGVHPDGNIAGDPKAQIEHAWHNLLAVLAAADMEPQDIVKVTAYLTSREDIEQYREIRDRMLAGTETASTLILVCGLAHPDSVVEIEAIAAKI